MCVLCGCSRLTAQLRHVTKHCNRMHVHLRCIISKVAHKHQARSVDVFEQSPLLCPYRNEAYKPPPLQLHDIIGHTGGVGEGADPLIVGADEWDLERAEAPVIATGCKY